MTTFSMTDQLRNWPIPCRSSSYYYVLSTYKLPAWFSGRRGDHGRKSTQEEERDAPGIAQETRCVKNLCGEIEISQGCIAIDEMKHY